MAGFFEELQKSLSPVNSLAGLAARGKTATP